MCERGRILTRGLQCSAQGFAGASGDEFLTRCLQCSAQGFAGANRSVQAGMCERGRFFFKIVGLRKNKGVSLW